MNRLQMLELLTYINEATLDPLRRDYNVLSRLHRSLLDSCEDDKTVAASVGEYVSDYYNLQKHHTELKASYDATVVRIRELQAYVALPSAGVPWGPDWNSIVHKVNNLHPVKAKP